MSPVSMLARRPQDENINPQNKGGGANCLQYIMPDFPSQSSDSGGPPFTLSLWPPPLVTVKVMV